VHLRNNNQLCHLIFCHNQHSRYTYWIIIALCKYLIEKKSLNLSVQNFCTIYYNRIEFSRVSRSLIGVLFWLAIKGHESQWRLHVQHEISLLLISRARSHVAHVTRAAATWHAYTIHSRVHDIATCPSRLSRRRHCVSRSLTVRIALLHACQVALQHG